MTQRIRLKLYKRHARKPHVVYDVVHDHELTAENAPRIAAWAIGFSRWCIGDRLTLSDDYAGGGERYQFRVGEFSGSPRLGIEPSLRRLYR